MSLAVLSMVVLGVAARAAAGSATVRETRDLRSATGVGVETFVRTEARDGKLVAVTTGGTVRELSANPVDTVARVSPDGQAVAFLRSVGPTEDDESSIEDLWVLRVADSTPMRIVMGRAATEPEDNLTELQLADWTPDGRRVVFSAAAWAVSGAVHLADVEARAERLLSPGRPAAVVPAGPYAGYVLVGTSAMRPKGGRYELFALHDTAGRRVLTFEGDGTSPAYRAFRAAYLGPQPSAAAAARFQPFARSWRRGSVGGPWRPGLVPRDDSAIVARAKRRDAERAADSLGALVPLTPGMEVRLPANTNPTVCLTPEALSSYVANPARRPPNCLELGPSDLPSIGIRQPTRMRVVSVDGSVVRLWAEVVGGQQGEVYARRDAVRPIELPRQP